MVMQKPTANSEQVLEVLRDVLLKHMNGPDLGPWHQVQSAVRIGYSGNLLTGDDIIAAGTYPSGSCSPWRTGTSTS